MKKIIVLLVLLITALGTAMLETSASAALFAGKRCFDVDFGGGVHSAFVLGYSSLTGEIYEIHGWELSPAGSSCDGRTIIPIVGTGIRTANGDINLGLTLNGASGDGCRTSHFNILLEKAKHYSGSGYWHNPSYSGADGLASVTLTNLCPALPSAVRIE